MADDTSALYKIPEYDECEIELQAAEAGGYVTIVKLPNRAALGSEAAIQLDWEKLAEAKDNGPAAEGAFLFDTFFTGGPRDKLVEERGLVAQQQKDLRLGLRIPLNLEKLHPLSWELLYDTKSDMPFAVAPAITLFRTLDVNAPEGEPLAEHPLKVLVVVSSPSNLQDKALDAIDPVAAREKLKASFDKFAGQIKYTFLEKNATLVNLREALEDDTYHVLHILAHGVIQKDDQGAKKSFLVLQKDDGTAEFVPEDSFTTIFEKLSRLRLVVLISCLSAAHSSANALTGLAPRLAGRGIPAVVAMQKFIQFDAAQTFTENFYKWLAQLGIVDAAVNRARYALYTDPQYKNTGSWGIPVLFMRTARGQLFTPRFAEEGTEFPPNVRRRFIEVLSSFVNRDEYFAQFRDAIDKPEKPRILFLYGVQGMGKTWLINRCAAWCARQQIPWSGVDFSAKDTWDYAFVLDQLAAGYSNGATLTDYTTARAQAEQAGHRQLSTPEVRAALTRTFMRNLAQVAQAKPLTLFVDSMHLGSEHTPENDRLWKDLFDWLWKELLIHFAPDPFDKTSPDLSHVTVVLATRDEPALEERWQGTISKLLLKGLELQDFLQLAPKLGLSQPPEALRGMFIGLANQPDHPVITPAHLAKTIQNILQSTNGNHPA